MRRREYQSERVNDAPYPRIAVDPPDFVGVKETGFHEKETLFVNVDFD